MAYPLLLNKQGAWLVQPAALKAPLSLAIGWLQQPQLAAWQPACNICWPLQRMPAFPGQAGLYG